MRVAIIVREPNTPIWTLMAPVAKETGAHLFSLAAPPGDSMRITDPTFADFDLVHFGYFAWAIPLRDDIVPPTTGIVHHIELGRADVAYQWLTKAQLSRLVVIDPRFIGPLGEMGFTNVTHIPQAFDHTPYHRLPPPPGPFPWQLGAFTIGAFGTEYPQKGPYATPGQSSKRFHVIEAAARAANCDYLGMTFMPERTVHDTDMVGEFFSRIHCYVNASFCEGGPLPPQQALLCGRPVITTHTGFIESLVSPGWNGHFFDGSVSDLVTAIHAVREDYEGMARRAAEVSLPTVAAVSAQYLRLWQKVVDA